MQPQHKTKRRLHTIWRIPDDLWAELQPLLPPEKLPGARGRTNRVNAVLVRKRPASDSARKEVEAELRRTRQRLEHIKEAIAQGIITSTTKTMLEEAEARATELEAALQAPAKPSVVALPAAVERYLSELKGVLYRDNARARHILAKLIGEVLLRRHGDRLVAELRGNLQGILDLSCDPSGAGSPIPMQPSTVIDHRIVA